MIFTDGVHLVSDHSLDELHDFAKKMGLRRAWFQNHRNPHYDLTTPNACHRAIRAGAQAISRRDLARLIAK